MKGRSDLISLFEGYLTTETNVNITPTSNDNNQFRSENLNPTTINPTYKNPTTVNSNLSTLSDMTAKTVNSNLSTFSNMNATSLNITTANTNRNQSITTDQYSNSIQSQLEDLLVIQNQLLTEQSQLLLKKFAELEQLHQIDLQTRDLENKKLKNEFKSQLLADSLNWQKKLTLEVEAFEESEKRRIKLEAQLVDAHITIEEWKHHFLEEGQAKLNLQIQNDRMSREIQQLKEEIKRMKIQSNNCKE